MWAVGMYDGLKRLYKKHTKQDDVGLAPSIACGVASSFTGQMLAFPLENIARRLQVTATVQIVTQT